MRTPLPTLVACAAAACAAPAVPAAAGATEARELVHLRAFARLYGVLRFFHPSDEAAATDWNRYAVLGAGRVLRAPADGLEATLEALVEPIAPTVRILGPGEAPGAGPLPAPQPDLVPVAWQYEGPGFGLGGGPYRSKRTGRVGRVAPEGRAEWTAVSRAIDVRAHAGAPFRLRAVVRAGPSGRVGAWARVDLDSGAHGFFDNMQDRMVTSSAWTEAVIEGTIDPAAARLVFGGLILGDGDAWLDDFALEIDGAPVPIPNPGFEGGRAGWSPGIRGTGEFHGEDGGYRHDAVDGGHTGERSLAVGVVATRLTADLFDARPAAGEVVVVDLGGGLRAEVPIAVWSTKGRDPHTVPVADPAPLEAALAELTPSLADADTRAADLIVAWSVLDQFYPYFDVTGTDWSAVLDATLDDALDDATAADHEQTLERLIAAALDGHGSAQVPGEPTSGLPLRLAWAEDQLVVAASAVPEVVAGDRIVAIGGVAAAAALDAEMATVSGSPQWRRHRALTRLGLGPRGGTVALTLARADGAAEVTVTRGQRPDAAYAHPPLARLDDGSWYVDLDRATMPEVERELAAIAAAPAVVFDLRGYPNGTHGVLEHLLGAPDHARWMHVAQQVRPALPGRPRPVPGWADEGWELRPSAPKIGGRVAFLTGPGAISYAESVMGYVEALGLDIVGSATAGTNGNVRVVDLPSGASFSFTGMKVTRHDGTPSHLVGIRPTVPVEPTVDGLRAGSDEVLERALVRLRTRE